MLPITRKISAYNHSSGNSIKYLVLHDTGNKTDSASGNANYFNGGDRQASAHYFVDDSSIYQVVEDYNASWHCGDGAGRYGITNYNSIGIEMCRVNNTVTATTEANAIELVKYLMNKYSITADRVVRHYDASRKCCPSSFNANNWARWNSFKNRIEGEVKMELKPTHYINSKNNVNVYKEMELTTKYGELVPGEEVEYVYSNDTVAYIKFGKGVLDGCIEKKYITEIGKEPPVEEPPVDPTPETPEKNYKVIITCKDKVEAELIRGFLSTVKVEEY